MLFLHPDTFSAPYPVPCCLSGTRVLCNGFSWTPFAVASLSSFPTTLGVPVEPFPCPWVSVLISPPRETFPDCPVCWPNPDLASSVSQRSISCHDPVYSFGYCLAPSFLQHENSTRAGNLVLFFTAFLAPWTVPATGKALGWLLNQ